MSTFSSANNDMIKNMMNCINLFLFYLELLNEWKEEKETICNCYSGFWKTPSEERAATDMDFQHKNNQATRGSNESCRQIITGKQRKKWSPFAIYWNTRSASQLCSCSELSPEHWRNPQMGICSTPFPAESNAGGIAQLIHGTAVPKAAASRRPQQHCHTCPVSIPVHSFQWLQHSGILQETRDYFPSQISGERIPVSLCLP